jgi:pimeloyl-ACP methyl ester carboxylesterase
LQAVINGTRLSWREEGAGEPILFVHAFPFQSGFWDQQLIALPPGWRAIAPDLRGFGRSAGSGSGPYTMDLFADDLVALLDHLDLKHAVICGLSMGGYVAFSLYRRYRARARALILCSTRPGADSEEGKKNRAALAARVRTDGIRAVIDAMLPKLLSEHTIATQPDLVNFVQQLMQSNQPETIARALEGMAMRDNSEDMLRTIDVPTLIVHGEEDAIIPPGEAQLMARGIRGARIKLLPQVGHLSNLEMHSEFNRFLRDFLVQLPPFWDQLKFA